MTNYAISQRSLYDILDGESNYSVPYYQRAYVWTNDNVGELWSDLMQIYMEDPSKTSDEYLLGSIVVETKNKTTNNSYSIVDGQQRLITLTLLFCAIRESVNGYLLTKKSDVDKAILKNLVDEINDLTSQNNKGIIALNDDNSDRLFQSIQLGEINIDKLNDKLKSCYKSNEKLSDASKKLIGSYKLLLGKVKKLCENCKLESTDAELVKAVDVIDKIILNVRKKNLFVHVNILHDGYSHQVFQSINSKGRLH